MLSENVHYECLCAWLAGAPRAFDHPRWSWETLVATAASEGVLPAVFPQMQRLGFASELPSEVLDFFSSFQQLSLERNRAILAEAEEIGGLLSGCGIEAVFLKGIAYLLTGVYADPCERYLSDIDILVPETQLRAAVKALRDAVYVESDSRAIASAGHHHALLYRPNQLTPGIEVHRSIGLAACEALLPACDVLFHSKSWNIAGSGVRVPSLEHLIIHHVAHSQIHQEYCERISPSLRSMYDFLLLTRQFKSIDWAEIEQRFSRQRQYGTLALYLLRVHAILGAELPFPVRQNWLTDVRRYRRQALRTMPKLRRADPIYIFRSCALPRLRLLPYLLPVSGGKRYIFKRLIHPTFYRHLVADVENMHHLSQERLGPK
jgi:hypothetical protein